MTKWAYQKTKSLCLQLIVGQLEGKRLNSFDCLGVVADDSSPGRLSDLLKLSCRVEHNTSPGREGGGQRRHGG